jgi:hypothetical protein
MGSCHDCAAADEASATMLHAVVIPRAKRFRKLSIPFPSGRGPALRADGRILVAEEATGVVVKLQCRIIAAFVGIIAVVVFVE